MLEVIVIPSSVIELLKLSEANLIFIPEAFASIVSEYVPTSNILSAIYFCVPFALPLVSKLPSLKSILKAESV